jgi:hypothetical protein
MITNELITSCLKILNEENVKQELCHIYTPLLNTVLQYLMPYIYLALIFILINFILLLLIFTMLLQNRLPKFSNIFYRVK